MKPYANNPRQITRKQAADLKDSLSRLGDLGGIVHNIRTDEIIGGNQRTAVMAGGEVVITETLPEPDEQGTVAWGYVVWQGKKYSYRQVDWTDAQAAEANIRANLNGGTWDFDALANGFDAGNLVEWGFDVEALTDAKRSASGIDALLASLKEEPPDDPGAQMDRTDELREKWGTEPGQLWRIPSKNGAGEHRIVCGDCTDRATVERVMGGERAAMCFTSPPYNAGVSAKLRGNTSVGDNLYGVEYDDNQTQPAYLELLNGFTREALISSKYVFVNIQLLSGNKRAFINYLAEYRDNLADIAIWDKGHAAPQQAQRVMDSRFEFVLVLSSSNATRAIGTRNFRGMVHNVYCGTPQRHNDYAEVHAATFPIDLPEHFIETFTNSGEQIYEPFLGSGTTLVAAERLARYGRGIEISPAYTAVSLQRLADMGLEPYLSEAAE